MVLGLSRTSSAASLSNMSKTLNRTPTTGSLTNALKRFSTGNLSGLPGASILQGPGLSGVQHATTEEDIMDEEQGDWKYLVIDPKGIRAHGDASYSKDTKSTTRYAEGTVIEVDRRRKSGWTTFLGLKGCKDSSSAWLFDVSPKDKKVRMIEVEVSTGDWMYEACSFECVPVLPFPSAAPRKASKGGSASLQIHEVVLVTKRVRPVSGKGSYLKLADGRGWVLDFVDGRRVLEDWVPKPEPLVPSSPEIPSCFLEGTDLGPPEFGEWNYVVLDPRGMSLRSEATYDPNYKIERRIHEGEVVVVDERRTGDGMTFLHLSCPQGWVFDQQLGKNSRVRMMEADVQRGTWHYVVSAESGVALRTRCSFSESTKCGKGPLKGALIEISERVRVGDTTFLQLKDGGRWIFDAKGGRKVLFGPVQPEEAPAETVATVRALGGVYLLQSPTKQKWAIGKMLLLQYAKVNIIKFFQAEYSKWAFVSKPGSGMEGWVRMDDLCLEESSPASSGLRSTGSTPCQSVASKEAQDFHKNHKVPKTFTKAQCQEALNAPMIGAQRMEQNQDGTDQRCQ